MSDSYGTDVPGGSGVAATDSSGPVETATQEAVQLKDTAAGQAKDVLGTAKDEASSVIGEAKTQAKDLYAQSRTELTEQAATQQQRIAAGLHAVGDELGAMASQSDGSGVAGDLVRQVSDRLSSAASWLGDRDPGSVLTEVRRYARRKPATFIFGALVAGVAVGRLTRALAANASEDATETAPVAVATVPPLEPWNAPAPVAEVDDTPIYAQATPVLVDGSVTEDGYGRPDSV